MRSLMVMLGLSLALPVHALTQTVFEENTNVDVHLSESNTNRLVVRGDKITRAHFPQGLLGIQNEEDGSLYVKLVGEAPFTLFLTTASGKHFSATINRDAGLGKTIEFIPKVRAALALPHNLPRKGQLTPAYIEPLRLLMTHMMQSKKPVGFWVKHQHGQVIHMKHELRLVPKLLYHGRELTGEVMALYNTSRVPVDVHEAWFMRVGVKAISLSTNTLLPKHKAWVYRVSRHG
jgi:conjugal transfer pilus assembly protein TraK